MSRGFRDMGLSPNPARCWVSSVWNVLRSQIFILSTSTAVWPESGTPSAVNHFSRRWAT